ncbi:DUF1445 domain-containing protein [Mesorhizobium sp. M1E.F.Ca.ET.045.02.1.1]|uniref:D-glutamate cyclase family protein n=1 Tax=Mesorhizobium sp. M1E.F.Ca.ET.045.02.1.1 TaxID=2493672 RepID=UPI000F755037|nr:DUF1445 domain-containing protein [Mesorhizobium sp. M1E.F.Ca.ET.045.02.1.1]AZO22764.1 DUF1445 domain-containing protein [Mesorhizobium sp. M1E.F.Ca.ET.045.02.1.1]
MARQTISPVYEDLRRFDANRLRRLVRTGAYEGHTGGLARGKLQVNVVILPRAFASDFHQFCVHNPKACPLVGLSRAGSPLIPALGDIDIRTDAPQYNVYRFGELTGQRTDIIDLWQDDFGPPSPFRAVPLTVETPRAGPFAGQTVVSMRPVRSCDVDKVRALTARFPHTHGSPIHVGEPSIIGIYDMTAPDWGDAVELVDGEVPVFWASSVTAQDALARAKLAISVTVSPGHMLVTDVDARAFHG